jgi:MATE family multidrug resistance protein
MSFVDTAMVGRLGPASLGGVGIGNGILFAFMVFGLGCVLGIEPLVSQALGAGEEARARRVFWQGIRVSATVGAPLTVLVAVAPQVLAPVGVDPETASEVQKYLFGRLPNVIPFLAFAAARAYLQAKTVTRPIVISMIAANVANFLGNAILIFGDEALEAVGLPAIGLPALGVFGAGLSSSLAALLSLWILARAIQGLPAPPDPARRALDPALRRTILHLGSRIGFQFLAEVGVFALASVLAGAIGKQAAAAHQVAITLASFTFCVALGIGAATSVRVGFHVGRGDTPGARLAGFTGLSLAAGFMTLSALTFLAIPAPLAAILTDDPAVLRAAVPLVMIAAVFQLSDGAQAVAAGALRGAGDAQPPLLANVAGHYAVGLPIAVGLGFGADLGAAGIWWGLCAGLTAVGVALILRFAVLSSRPIRRV